MSIELVIPSNHLVPYHSLLFLPSIFPNTRVFSTESDFHIRWSKYWSFSFSISLPMNIQDWFPLGWTGLILKSKGLSRVFSNTAVQKHRFLSTQLSLWSYSHIHTRKTLPLTRWTFVGKVMSLLFNMLSKLVIAFLLRIKHLLISRLQSPSAVILEPKKTKSVTVSIVSPSICHEVMGLDAMTLVFWMLGFKSAFSLSSFTFIKRLFSSSLLSSISMVSYVYLRLLMFLPAILIPACVSSSQAFHIMYSA